MKNVKSVLRNGILSGFMCLMILSFYGSLYAQKSSQKLVAEFDCTKEYPTDTYFSHGKIQVSASSAGRYREAEAVPLSRFGYRFRAEHIGKPYLAVVRYPDDKRRYMCMMDGTTYDMTIGVFTGVNQPLSGKMQEIRKIFWPRWNDCSIAFMTWSNGEPAAVSDIKIYELEGLPALELKNVGENNPRMRIRQRRCRELTH